MTRKWTSVLIYRSVVKTDGQTSIPIGLLSKYFTLSHTWFELNIILSEFLIIKIKVLINDNSELSSKTWEYIMK